MSELNRRIALAHRLADAAGAVIRPHFRQRIDVVDKGGRAGKAYDPVTAADEEAEHAIRALIRAECPGDSILGEEHGAEAGTSGYGWVIDPIDGTRSFIIGQVGWGTLIALTHHEQPVFGLLDQPVLRERFSGGGGAAEFRSPDGAAPMRVRACDGLKSAVVSTTHPWNYFDPREQGAFRRLADEARMSRFGGDCYAYGLLALGYIDIVAEARLKPWDIQPLIPIIEGAGGIVTDWNGNALKDGGKALACGDRRVHEDAVAILSGRG